MVFINVNGVVIVDCPIILTLPKASVKLSYLLK